MDEPPPLLRGALLVVGTGVVQVFAQIVLST
jgi:hypothetical protein